VVETFTEGLDHDMGCHFYPAGESGLPPIIREPIRDAKVEHRGHILVYHTLPGLLEQIDRYTAAHADRRFIVYGYPQREDAQNMHFEGDRSRFAADLAAADLAAADAYVGTAGFQSISEAFHIGKKIAAHPIKGQYEQIWNAVQLEHHGMGCWYGEPYDLAEDAGRSRGPAFAGRGAGVAARRGAPPPPPSLVPRRGPHLLRADHWSGRRTRARGRLDGLVSVHCHRLCT
jgi:hypothetical protein